jgi:hypothetical protein
MRRRPLRRPLTLEYRNVPRISEIQYLVRPEESLTRVGHFKFLIEVPDGTVTISADSPGTIAVALMQLAIGAQWVENPGDNGKICEKVALASNALDFSCRKALPDAASNAIELLNAAETFLESLDIPLDDLIIAMKQFGDLVAALCKEHLA